jgi:hypothetical protein
MSSGLDLGGTPIRVLGLRVSEWGRFRRWILLEVLIRFTTPSKSCVPWNDATDDSNSFLPKVS